ncbi:MAG: restriction endonuclease subunit S [Accumulibacter sp.]|jgi:type I restriction enzyme S subunit|uniref:restriction endonuclease subunit S n=1 Tax=Accumulibacter sp. TaxID=2053492 RepID=UPI002FC2A104
MSLPEGWIESTVGRVVVDLQSGFAQKPGEDDDGMTPQIRTHNITPEGKITLEGIKHVSASAKELERCRLAVNDVVFNNTNSEEWVGKTAVFDQEGEYVFSNHMTRLRADTSLINPAFLGSYLHLLWSMGYSKTRAKRWVSQAGIEGAALASFKIPLPALPEQQRIVDVLQGAEDLAKTKRLISEKIDQLVRTIYWEHFGAWYTPDGLRDSVRISEYVDDSQYGVSEAMEGRGSHAVLRMNSITTSGWLDLSDLKYANLSKRDADSTILKNGDLLFNRTNSKELVGKCAVWRGTKENFSFASYLVRFRLKHGMLPEYLWATLNSAYGKYRLVNAAKQAVSMANVSPTDLGRLTVPLPPLPLQENFARLVTQIEALRTEMLSKVGHFEELRALVTQQAFSGELTEGWRKQHDAEILNATRARDELLRERCAKVIRPLADGPTLNTRAATTQAPTHRRWLLDELSEFQQRVFSAFVAYTAQPLLADDPDAFAAFCADDALTEQLAGFSYSPDRIRRTLSQLAALGLIARITLPHVNPLTLERQYLQAFRPLRDDEHTQFADVEALRRALSPPGEVDE